MFAESLDPRLPMASDLGWSPQWSDTSDDVLASQVASALASDRPASASPSLVAEGEAATDLVAFAKALTAAGLTLYGADWADQVTEQLKLFGDGAPYLNYVEVTNGDRSLNSIGVAQNIAAVPTWAASNGDRVATTLTIAELSAATGIPIPMSSTPSMFPIGPHEVMLGSPFHVPIDAYDPNGNPLTITVTSSNPANVTAQILQNNQSARMTVDGYGEMVFQLFNSEAPRPVNRFVTLAQSGFYNTTDTKTMTFHRAAPNFVIQGGDPLGNGSGGSTLGNFDDQFNLNLQHNRAGVLSYAKTTDDTNDSQFFVTAQATRSLDYNHSIFGQLIEGDKARAGINRIAIGANERPAAQVIIRNVEIFNDIENGLLRLIAVGEPGSTSDITVTATDTEGNHVSQVFTVTVAEDTNNGAPFLNDIPLGQGTTNRAITLNLASQDEEGDPFIYSIFKSSDDAPYTASLDPQTSKVLIQPNTGFSGLAELIVIVQRDPPSSNPDEYDFQRVQIRFDIPFSISVSPTIVFEKNDVATVTVTRLPINLGSPLEIVLTSSDPSKATIPATVVIPTNQTTATFQITAADNLLVEGNQEITISGEALGYSASVTVDIVDDDTVSPWHNVPSPYDVDNNGSIAPLDVLLVINQISRLGTSLLPIPQQAVVFFVDTDGDFFLSPIDVLRVINALNRRGTTAGEGESADSSIIQSSALSLWLSDETTQHRNRRTSGSSE